MSDNGISKSKQKRQAQASARAEQKKKKVIATFWAVFIPLLLVAAVVAAIVAYQLSKLDYSRYLNKDGKIKDVRAADYVDVNLAGFSYAKDDISADEATIESDISYALSQHAYVSDDPELEAGYGDKVQLSYTAQMDGAAYGDPVDNRDMTVGNEEIAAEFDDALLGLHAGDETDVDVTYPADSENTELAGKTVSYHISFKGVYQDPEFTDEFVKEYYSENAFAYHYFPSSVFLVLALGYVFALLRENRPRWRLIVLPFAALCVLLFVLFYPVLSGATYDPNATALGPSLLQWLPTWPI